MSDCYLDYGSVDEVCTELLHLRQENENLRNLVKELRDELRECYEHIKIDKMDDYDDDELDDIEYSLYGYESEFSNGI